MDVATMRTAGNLPARLSDAFITAQINGAVMKVKLEIGIVRYNEINGYSATSTDSENKFLYDKMQESIKYFTLEGLVSTGNIIYYEGMSSIIESTENAQFFNTAEIIKLSEYYNKKGKEAAYSLLSVEEPDLGGFSISVI